MSTRLAVVLVAACVVAGGVLRGISCWNDFWLDEIWTYQLARRLGSGLGVFTAVHHSNNHHLNTLLFVWIGEPAHWAVYRLPSWLAGTASIGLGAAVAWRRGRLEAVLTALLTAACFVLVHFSSEARGYALALAFALLALWLLERDLERPRVWSALAFGAAVALGFLSQLVFLFFWAGCAAQSALVLARRTGSRGGCAAGLVRLHALPLAAFALLYAVDLRMLRVGGGPPIALEWLLPRLGGFGLGLPVLPALAGPSALLLALLFGLGLRQRWRAGDPLWLLVAVSVFAAPLPVLAALRPEVVAVRYFIVSLWLGLLLGACLLAAGLRRGGTARVGAIALLGLFLAGSATHAARFLQHGRGGYSQALLAMARETPGPRIQVGSDHDFRNRLVLQFYARLLPPGRELDYRTRERWPADGPDWFVRHASERPGPPPAPLRLVPGGPPYEPVAEFDHAAISGFYWVLYRRVPEPASPSRPPAPGGTGEGSPPWPRR